MDYFYVFMQSNLLEIPVVLWLLKRQSWGQRILLVSLINSVTHPLVFFGWMALPLSYLLNILLAEAFAIGTETFFYRKVFADLSWSKAFFVSSRANLASWQLGPILTWFFF